MSEPKTSETDSLSAPDWPEYARFAVYCVTPWVSSWPMTSTGMVKSRKISPSPSPKTIWLPSQKALLYFRS